MDTRLEPIPTTRARLYDLRKAQCKFAPMIILHLYKTRPPRWKVLRYYVIRGYKPKDNRIVFRYTKGFINYEDASQQANLDIVKHYRR